MYKLFLCLRYLYKRRIALFAVAAVSLCVAMVLIVMSVMGGFLDMVKDRSRGMLGDLVVEGGTLQGFPFYGEFIQQVKTEMPDEIVEATPVIITYGVLRFPRSGMTKAVQVVGIKLEETYRVNEFKSGLFYERFYPGTTTFVERAEPYLGLTPDGIMLPPEFEAARKQGEANLGQREVDDAWRYEQSVFDVDAGESVAGLNQGKLSTGLRVEFEQFGLREPERGEVRVVDQGKKWVLRHRAGAYTIKRQGGKLAVSGSLYAGPGHYARPFQDLFAGGPGWQGKPLPGAILGTDLCAERLKTGGYDRFCSRGETLALAVLPFSDKTGFEEGTGMEKLALRYVDDNRTGVFEIDSQSVYLDFALLQRNVNMMAYAVNDEELLNPTATAPTTRPVGPEVPARTTQVQIKLSPKIDSPRKVIATRDKVTAIWKRVSSERLADLRDAPGVLERIEGSVGWVKVQTWEEKQAKYIGAVEKEKYLVTTLFGVISIVAVVLVGVIFYMIVQQKTRDIGIIKSVGATSMGVAGIFLSYGAAVGVVGGAIGILLGTVFVWNINRIQDLLIWISPAAQVWNPEVYAFDHIPNQVNPWDALYIFGAAIAASVLGSLIAAWKASRVWPVESLRYE